MLHRTVFLAFIICFICVTKGGYQNTPEHTFTFKDGGFLRTTTQNASHSQILPDPTGKTAQFTLKTKQQKPLNKRVTRGIIFLNEEFDVPAKPGVKNTLVVTSDKSVTDEGSGDQDILNFTSTYSFFPETSSYQQTLKELESHSTMKDMDISGDHGIVDPNEEPTENISYFANFTISDSCLNRTCGISDLIIHGEEMVPEKSNVTVKCISNSFKESSSFVYWYRYNGTNYNLEIYQHQQVDLMLSLAKPEDSGKYVCVRLLEDQSCCFKDIYINIYEVPAYKYHLLTIGLAAAVFLLTCLLLAAYRSRIMKKYTKQFAIIRSTEKPLLM